MTAGGLLRRVIFVEFRFFFGSKCMHQEDTAAPPGFGMTAMRADHIVQRIRDGHFSREFIHLKRTAASGVGTSLELHGWGEKLKKPMGRNICCIYFIAVSTAHFKSY